MMQASCEMLKLQFQSLKDEVSFIHLLVKQKTTTEFDI